MRSENCFVFLCDSGCKSGSVLSAEGTKSDKSLSPSEPKTQGVHNDIVAAARERFLARKQQLKVHK